jgi:hypothetical protein
MEGNMSTVADDQLCTTSGPPLIMKAGDSLHRRTATCCPLSPLLFTAKRVKDNPSHDEHSVRHAACMHLTSGSPVDDHDLRRDRHRLFDSGGQHLSREVRSSPPAARRMRDRFTGYGHCNIRFRRRPPSPTSCDFNPFPYAAFDAALAIGILIYIHLESHPFVQSFAHSHSSEPSVVPSFEISFDTAKCGTQFNSCIARRVSAHESPICTSVDTASRHIRHWPDSALIASQRAWRIMLLLTVAF